MAAPTNCHPQVVIFAAIVCLPNGEESHSIYALLYVHHAPSLFSLRPASIMEAIFIDFYIPVCELRATL